METSENSNLKPLRPGLWDVVNERYPGSMIHNDDYVPMAKLDKPLAECRLGFVSTSGVQLKGSMPFDVVHPIGDYTFRKVPSLTQPERFGNPPDQVSDFGCQPRRKCGLSDPTIARNCFSRRGR